MRITYCVAALTLSACSDSMNPAFYNSDGPAGYPDLLTPSPSGMIDLPPEGHQLLTEIQIRDEEDLKSWASRVKKQIPQLELSQPISSSEISEIEKEAGFLFPSSLKEAWEVFGRVGIDYDVFLFTPSEIVQFNKMYPSFLPEITKEKIFFGGMDGHNFAVALNSDDSTVTDWEHETGWTGHSEASIYRHLAEQIAWYATYMTPFCFEHGYVDPEKYP